MLFCYVPFLAWCVHFALYFFKFYSFVSGTFSLWGLSLPLCPLFFLISSLPVWRFSTWWCALTPAYLLKDSKLLFFPFSFYLFLSLFSHSISVSHNNVTFAYESLLLPPLCFSLIYTVEWTTHSAVLLEIFWPFLFKWGSFSLRFLKKGAWAPNSPSRWVSKTGL